MFLATDFRLKRLKKSPLPFQHHKAILQPDHNTNPKSSDTTATNTKPPPLNPETTQKTQSTSTNTPPLLLLPPPLPIPPPLPLTTLSAPLTPAPPPAPLLPPTPAHKLTLQYLPLCSSTSPSCPGSTHPPHLSPYHYHPPSHPPSLYPPPSFPVPCRISSSSDSGGPPCHPINNQRRSPSPGNFKASPHPANGQRCTLTHMKNVFVQNSSQN